MPIDDTLLCSNRTQDRNVACCLPTAGCHIVLHASALSLCEHARCVPGAAGFDPSLDQGAGSRKALNGRDAGMNATSTAAYLAQLPVSGSLRDAAAETTDESPMSTPAGLMAMMRRSGVSEVVIAEVAKTMAKQR